MGFKKIYENILDFLTSIFHYGRIQEIRQERAKRKDGMLKRELKGMRTDNIQIFQCFKEKPPKPEKMKKKEQYFNETGLLQSAIILDSRNYLIDGYTSYLLAVKYGLEYVPIRYGKREVVKGYHKTGGDLYTWEVPGILLGRIHSGDRVVVETERGLRNITVVSVKDYLENDGNKPTKMVYRIKSRKR